MWEWGHLLASDARLGGGRGLQEADPQGACASPARGSGGHGASYRRQRFGARRFGGAHTGPNPTDRGKNGCKRHLITDANGVPLAVEVTPANVVDGAMAIELLDIIPPIAGCVGRPIRKPLAYQGDRGYGWQSNIDEVERRGIVSELARPSDDTHGSGLGVTRWVVEAALSWFNNFRRLRICYERTKESFQALHDLAAALICWNKLVNAGFVDDCF